MKTVCCNTHHYHKVENRTICLSPSCDNYLGFTSTYRDLTVFRRTSALALFLIGSLFTFDDFSKNIIACEVPLRTEQCLPLTKANLLEELKSQEIICVNEVFAQMMLESGNLRSGLLKRTNNMLGMRFPAKRPTAACGIYLPAKDTIILGSQQELKKYAAQNNYAVYNTWQDAVADYKLWQIHNFKMTDRYLEFLGKVYAEDTMYVHKLKSISSKQLPVQLPS
ncbi:MAG TPA: glucosaminidase domain-containing protein [Bacteroidia bacterium]|nr:glucosaminidase domain-containing protein [Bacteroidia bacterium]